MSITLEIAERNLQKWLDVEMQLSAAGSYTVGSRTLTYRNLKEVRESIEYWQMQVNKLKRNGSFKTYRAIPFY